MMVCVNPISSGAIMASVFHLCGRSVILSWIVPMEVMKLTADVS